MDSAPLIGITGKRRSGKDLKGSLKVMGDLPLDVYWDDYAQGIISAGGIPVWLPVGADPTLYIERLDGLLMSGGADIQPEIYGAEIDPKTFNPEPIRDEFEISLLDAAFSDGSHLVSSPSSIRSLISSCSCCFSRRSSFSADIGLKGQEGD